MTAYISGNTLAHLLSHMCPGVYLSGLHSRSEALIGLTRAFDRGQTGWDAVQDRFKLDTTQLLELQDSLGFRYLSDGALAWQDPFRPLTRSLTGVTYEARYSRWFDTNTFYQKPLITSEVGLGKFDVDSFVQTNISPAIRNWKVSIPGPYSFSELSENEFYEDRDELLRYIAQAERQVVDRLVEAGVSLVQLSEPCLVYRPYREKPFGSAELDSALGAIKVAADGNPSKVIVHTFFGDPAPVFSRLLDLPVAGVGIDLYETDISTIHGKAPGKIVLGIVDARESHVEDPSWIAKIAKQAGRSLEADDFILAPNTDLRHVPRDIADQKAQALARASELLEEDLS